MGSRSLWRELDLSNRQKLNRPLVKSLTCSILVLTGMAPPDGESLALARLGSQQRQKRNGAFATGT
jgi:hypothetical protein